MMRKISSYFFVGALCLQSMFSQESANAFLYDKSRPISFTVEESFLVQPIQYESFRLAIMERHEYFPGNIYFSPQTVSDLEELRTRAENECHSAYGILNRYVDGKTEGDDDTNCIVANMLKLGLGIVYIPGVHLKVMYMLDTGEIFTQYKNLSR